MIQKSELKQSLSKIIETGEDVLIHASMNAIGPIEGGPDGLRDVILEILGAEGTLVMLSSTRQEFVETGIFNVKDSKSDVGALGESVRLHPEASRSRNPMVSFVAIGKRKEDYIKEYDSLLDKDSPMIRLKENGGKILLYGIGYAKCTMYHLSEERLEVDYNFYKQFTGKLIDWDGSSREVSQRYFVRKSMDTKKDASYAGTLFEKAELPLWKEPLGKGTIRSFYAADFDNFCTQELKKNPNLFLKNQ